MGDKMGEVIIIDDKKEDGLAETVDVVRKKGESDHDALLRVAKNGADLRADLLKRGIIIL